MPPTDTIAAMFTIAHLTDPHLAPVPRPTLLELMSKRVFGYFNWIVNRKGIHQRPILDALTKDLLEQPVDHIAVGGDLINLALPEEFGTALDWLQTLGSPEQVSVVPGNHDAYVPYNFEAGLGLWQAYMTPDIRTQKKLAPATDLFPYVRLFEKVALIGLRSGIPAPLFMASGELGPEQRAALERILSELGKQGFYRIIMIHHPPLPGQSLPQRGLNDAAELEAIMINHGVELVLYGHQHYQAFEMLETKSGQAAIVGAPSASSAHTEPNHLARYNLFRIQKANDKWNCEMTGRGLESVGGIMRELEKRLITG